MIQCKKCSTGRVFVDMTFTDGGTYELYCILCGDRTFLRSRDRLFGLVEKFVKEKLAV